jgi:hypothetical protein
VGGARSCCVGRFTVRELGTRRAQRRTILLQVSPRLRHHNDAGILWKLNMNAVGEQLPALLKKRKECWVSLTKAEDDRIAENEML